MSILTSHKNLIISGVVAILILVFGIAYNKSDLPKDANLKQDLPTNIAIVSTSSTNITNRDSDVDGLPDWEEYLYNSDPLKFDTDGDGTPDGVEVREGRDPSKANTEKSDATPNDIYKLLQDPHFATSSTDILGIKKEFFAKYLTVAGDDIRQQTYQDLLGHFDARKVTPKNEMVDLNISSDSGPQALHEYGNGFGLIIDKYKKDTNIKKLTEEEIVAEALKSSSTPILRQLQLPAIEYQNFANDLKALKTPSILAQYNLQIVNGYERMSLGLLSMQSLFTDPIVGAGGYEAYTKGKWEVTDGYAQIIVAFVKENITFTRDEPGAPFYYRGIRARTASSSVNYNSL